MITLQPREQKTQDLPEPVNSLMIVNETIARLEVEATIEEGVLTLKVVGLYLGKTVEAPYEEGKKVWKLG